MQSLTFSPSITIPLTHDCPWHCRYCGYRSDEEGLISESEIERLLSIAVKQGATEVLFMSGEMPDTLPHIQKELRQRGFPRFIDFAVAIAERCLEAGLLPHTNIGALSEAQLLALREVNASQGLMLEGVDDVVNQQVAPEKRLSGRIKTLHAAGRARVPYTSGILIGLGESQTSRRNALKVLAEIHQEHGHLQEIIIQNYIKNSGSRWEQGAAVTLEDYLDLIGYWREIASDVAIQIPPNLNPYWKELLPWIDDIGGISAEGDLINPLNPWKQVDHYREAALTCGRDLVPRPPVYPRYIREPGWLSDRVAAVLQNQEVGVKFHPNDKKCPSTP
jgi:7,8-didemethyl-8-hydroxy-5-deazariboflavin synthase CofG subunit